MINKSLSDDEFNKRLCKPVATIDVIMRSMGVPLSDDYRQRLQEYHNFCTEEVGTAPVSGDSKVGTEEKNPGDLG